MELHYEVELGVIIGREIGGVGGGDFGGGFGGEGEEGEMGGEGEGWMDFVDCEFFFF